MKKNILITGTNGYISKSLKSSLSDDTWNVKCISVRNDSWKEHSFKNYDVIIHAAALVHNSKKDARLSDYLQVNTNLPARIAEKAKNEGVPYFIFMSTMSVYGKTGNLGKDEIINSNTSLNPTTNYGFSKMKAEKKLSEIETEEFKVAIIRPPMIYGANCPGNFKKLWKAAKLLPIIPNIQNQRSALYINNFNKFIKQLILNETRGVFHPQDNYYFETTKIMKEIRNQLHKKTFIVNVPRTIYPLLNNVKILKKLYGNLTYDKKIDGNTKNLDISHELSSKVLESIANSTIEY